MTTTIVAQRDEWNAELERERSAGAYPRWPNEVMVKLLFGGYLRYPVRPRPGWRVLDVGCLMGSNLLPFAEAGCACHGVDLHVDMARAAEAVLADRGYAIECREGCNRALPYADGAFDLVLSVNTLHYEASAADVSAALREFRRVLRPGGALYVSTVAPQHDIQRRAERLGRHRYRIRDFGFRDGQEFYFFETAAHLRQRCLAAFEQVEIARVTERLVTMSLDFFVAVCRTPTLA